MYSIAISPKEQEDIVNSENFYHLAELMKENGIEFEYFDCELVYIKGGQIQVEKMSV